MKQAIITMLIIPLLISCCNKSHNTPNEFLEKENEFVWQSFEDKVFPTPKEDTAYTILDYVYTTDWMQRYIQFINMDFENSDDVHYIPKKVVR